MTPAVLFPAGLAALLGLAVPLLVHLARRADGQLTDFAALRWLRAKPRPRRRPRFDEWPLLVTRLALLALLALALAQPVLIGSAARSPWVAVTPGVDPSRAAALVRAGAHGVWLAPGFPALDRPSPTGPIPFGSLLRELDANVPTAARLTVLVPPVIETADAERPRLRHVVGWRIVPGRMTARAPERDVPLALAMRGAAGAGYLHAALTALLPPGGTLDTAPVTASLPRGGTLAWMAPGLVPQSVTQWARRGGMLLLPVTATLPDGPATIAQRDAVGAPLVEAVGIGRGRALRFTRPLAPSAMPELADAGFPAMLGRLLRRPRREPARVAAIDYAPTAGVPPTSVAVESSALAPWLAVLIAALFVGERWLATRRRRAPAP